MRASSPASSSLSPSSNTSRTLSLARKFSLACSAPRRGRHRKTLLLPALRTVHVHSPTARCRSATRAGVRRRMVVVCLSPREGQCTSGFCAHTRRASSQRLRRRRCAVTVRPGLLRTLPKSFLFQKSFLFPTIANALFTISSTTSTRSMYILIEISNWFLKKKS